MHACPRERRRPHHALPVPAERSLLFPEPPPVPAGLSLLFPVAKWALDRSLFILLSRVLMPSSGKHGKGKHGLSKKMAEALWKVGPMNVCEPPCWV